MTSKNTCLALTKKKVKWMESFVSIDARTMCIKATQRAVYFLAKVPNFAITDQTEFNDKVS